MNFFGFCEDEAIKIKVEGTTVHKFFSPESFLMWGLEPKAGNYKGYAQIVDMPIEEFIGLAEPIPKDDETRHSSLEDFKKDVESGKTTDWDIPYLDIKENEDCLWKVVGHDGRHRALLLKELGYKEMPVLLRIPDVDLNEELLPEILWCQNDRSIKRDEDFYPFPITEDNYKTPYASVADGIATFGKVSGMSVAQDKIDYGKSCDAPNLKDYLGKVDGKIGGAGKSPKECSSAKKNFADNFTANVAYREDNTMPARNLKEYLSKKK